MATETDAARDRVLAARAALGEELEVLEASARAAVDIPAKIGAARPRPPPSPAAPAFLVLGRPQRVFRGGRRAVTGQPEPLPEVDAARRRSRRRCARWATTATKVRGALERDFAAYAKQARQGPSGPADDPRRCRWHGRSSPAGPRRRPLAVQADDDELPGTTRADPSRAEGQTDHDDSRADDDAAAGTATAGPPTTRPTAGPGARAPGPPAPDPSARRGR